MSLTNFCHDTRIGLRTTFLPEIHLSCPSAIPAFTLLPPTLLMVTVNGLTWFTFLNLSTQSV